MFQNSGQLAVTETADDDLALVRASRSGDVDAFEELVKRYDRKLLRIALNVTNNLEDAEEAVQDAFFKAYRNLSQFLGNAKFSTWLTRIALNESLMKLRKRHRAKELSLDGQAGPDGDVRPLDVADWAPSPEQRYGESELRQILTRTLQGLRPALRVVFVLRDLEGFSTSQAAEALGITEVAVKTRVLRARLELRERLSKYFRKPARDTAFRPERTLETTAKDLPDDAGAAVAPTGIRGC